MKTASAEDARGKSVGDVARNLGVSPIQITSLFYSGRLNCDLCPIIGGRRLIPASYVPEIERVLRESGRIKTVAGRMGIEAKDSSGLTPKGHL